MLRALSSSKFAENVYFKGGTSLSKAWQLIERFSEDIDIAVNREFLGYGGELTKNQISDRLRRASCTFVRNDLKHEIENQLLLLDIPKSTFRVTVNETPITTSDPETIEIEYESVLPKQAIYLRDKVKVEVGARSAVEPFESVRFNSLLKENSPNDFEQEHDFNLQTILPSRTFIEKLFLMHEEFAKPVHEIRVDKMSRHLYDIEKMMDTEFAQEALANEEFYTEIIAHRKKFIGLKNFDYNSLMPKYLRIVPPDEVKTKYGTDYRRMQDGMIYGVSLPFNKLIKRIETLNLQINKFDF